MLIYDYMSIESNGNNRQSEEVLEISDADVESALEGGAFSTKQAEQAMLSAEKKAKLVELRTKVLELKKIINPSVLERQAEDLLMIKNLPESSSFDDAMEETVDRFYGMLEPDVQAGHSRLEVKLLLDATMTDVLKKRISQTAEAEVDTETN